MTAHIRDRLFVERHRRFVGCTYWPQSGMTQVAWRELNGDIALSCAAAALAWAVAATSLRILDELETPAPFTDEQEVRL